MKYILLGFTVALVALAPLALKGANAQANQTDTQTIATVNADSQELSAEDVAELEALEAEDEGVMNTDEIRQEQAAPTFIED